MSRRKRKIGDTVITKKDEQAIDEAYYTLKQLALAGKLREQTGTWQQRYLVWLSCFDLVMVPRADGVPKDHFGLVFDWSAVKPPQQDDIAKGDIQAMMHFQVMMLLRANALMILPKAEAERMRREELLAFYRISEEKTARVLAKAEAGDPIAFELLSDMLDQYHSCPTVQMSQIPEPLRQFSKLQRFIVSKRTSEKDAQRQRDAELVKVIYKFIDKGYSPTRDKRGLKDRTPCGWWIVWRAAKRLGLDISERQIERRWNEAVCDGLIVKKGRLAYSMAEQQTDLITMIDGMNLVTPIGGIIYPMEDVSAEVLDDTMRALFWAEGLVPNEDDLTDEQRETDRNLAKTARRLIQIVKKFEDYGVELNKLAARVEELEAQGEGAAPEVAVLTEQIVSLQATVESEFAQLVEEYPGLAAARVSTIPNAAEQLGTAGAIECARLLQLNATTEVHHAATREGVN